LNIKPCMGQISGTWELLLCEYWRKSMIIGEKNTDLKRLKLRFLTEIGRFHWNQGEVIVQHVRFVKDRGTCGSGERKVKIWIDFWKSPRFSLTSPLSQEREITTSSLSFKFWLWKNNILQNWNFSVAIQRCISDK
jgi:hypothetical protein